MSLQAGTNGVPLGQTMMDAILSKRFALTAAAVCGFCTWSNACSFIFDRGADLQPGEVQGKALRQDTGGPAPFAKIAVGGTTRIRRSGEDGTFVLRGFPTGDWRLQLFDDVDGDGRADRSARLSFQITEAKHAKGLFGVSDKTEPTSLMLGDVPLRGSFSLRGRVLSEDGTAAPVVGARVLAEEGEEQDGRGDGSHVSGPKQSE